MTESDRDSPEDSELVAEDKVSDIPSLSSISSLDSWSPDKSTWVNNIREGWTR